MSHLMTSQRSGLQPATEAAAPVRVAYLIDRLGIGGTETQLLALIRNLDRSRVEPHLILLDGCDATSRQLMPNDCPHVCLGVKSFRSWRAARKLGDLVRYLKRERIAILKMYFADSTYFGAVAGKLAGVKAIIRTRNNANHWMTPTHRWLGRLLNRFVTLTICNSEAGRHAVLRDERADPKSVVVIENGVDLERFAHIPPIHPSPQPGAISRVGMVANLRHVKGVDVLARAAAIVVHECPNVEFVVAGEGEQRAELEELVERLGLSSRFLLPGRTDDIPAFLATLDVAVLSSRSEGMPNAILEYMAAARPIVAARVGGIETLLSNERAVVVPPEDAGQLAVGIQGLLSDRHRAIKLGLAGREFINTKHAREKMIRSFVEQYERVSRSAGYAE